ncbi:hypothetical protein NEPAR06_1309 [Nematocida parisii]|uniref:uncharacterized protein n=1 Tax=Nematocida parisii (strain ERTm1 / ATCC PRA-289) TaxID=881290 RepID=UPI000264B6AC|nr:uncharacterized protein NEPG_02205 [Nematocida parisii ERTm1]EIJ92806.1 hypothetical protein NEPG_02205 [Nematocida parisii ERTm1]KAI5145025.1 hypothetical protein NEPAR07_1420 [Nematocida parisii]KAI5154701.1 hypothetical protein NEPAR06_1309 [Nematocida parisii]KAI5157639.1 hypothetical protein NEPAR05_1456 [Nematocida parisii]|eukprot:XP_013060032.1 hypothetical protein NEPG_02205 [Nematocida parisii ERTm1]
MADSSSHAIKERKHLETDMPLAFNTQLEPQEENTKGANSTGILQALAALNFRAGRATLTLNLETITALYPKLWHKLNPETRILLLQEELNRRSGSIEAAMANQLAELISNVSSTQLQEWPEELWHNAWQIVLSISEGNRVSAVANLWCFRDFAQITMSRGYEEWCYIMIGQTEAPFKYLFHEIALEFALKETMYPIRFTDVWNMGKGDRENANKNLLLECQRLDRLLRKKAGRIIHNQKKEKIHRNSNSKHRRFFSNCYRCGKRGHRARECRGEIQQDRRKDYMNNNKCSWQGWNLPKKDGSQND